VSTAVEAEEVDLASTHQHLLNVEQEISRARDRHNAFLKELGLPLLP
jgi:type I restriction enzyme M protein